MKTLVTGGAGFIGTNLVRFLLRETEHEVINDDKLTYAGNRCSLEDVASHLRYQFEKLTLSMPVCAKGWKDCLTWIRNRHISEWEKAVKIGNRMRFLAKRLPVVSHMFSLATQKANVLYRRPRNRRYRKAKIAMFHTGRCGSTVVCKMLNQHPHIYWGGEIFQRGNSSRKNFLRSPNFPRKTIQDCEDRAVSLVYGFETKYLPLQHLCSTCVNMPIEKYVGLLRQLGYSKFIVLQRENYLRRAISVEVARQKKQWHMRSKITKPTKVLIDTKNFLTGRQTGPLLELFRCIDVQYKKLHDIMLPNEALFLSYEKDIQSDPTKAYELVLEFLGLGPSPAIIELNRINPFTLDELVTNLDEIRNVLGNSEFSWMLDD